MKNLDCNQIKIFIHLEVKGEKDKKKKKKYIYIYICGGVKPGPMGWAQVQRFINNTSEEKKS